MESIHELREQLQSEKIKQRKDTWGYCYLRRGLSIYVTRLLISTGIRPDQITFLMLAFGVLSAVAIFFGWIFLGFLFIYLNILLDAVDGELARYKKVFSLRGAYLDGINHIAVPGLFFLAVTFWVSDIVGGVTYNIPLFILGVAGAFALPILVFVGGIHRQIFVRPYLENPELFPLVAHSRQTATAEDIRSFNLFHGAARFVYQSTQFIIVIIVLFLVYLAELVFFSRAQNHLLLSWIVAAYGALFVFYLMRKVIQGFSRIEEQVATLAHAQHMKNHRDE